MRKMACIRRLLALADPVPLTFASFSAKSFTRSGTLVHIALLLRMEFKLRISACPRRTVGQRSAHSPQWTQTSSSFTMMRAGLFQRRRGVKFLLEIDGRRGQAHAQVLFFAVTRDGEALHGTDIDAGVALDAVAAR